MSNIDTVDIWLSQAEKTHSAGASLAASLYTTPVTIWLQGELGAGKTTFLQGFFEALGIQDHVTSPTYALEQRYQSKRGEVMHIDLYRLTKEQAHALLLSSEDFSGIRCIEWSERLEKPITDGIGIRLEESEKGGRTLTVKFHDMLLPSDAQIEKWRKEVELPEHIVRHCMAVANTAERLGAFLLENGTILRPLALRRSAEIHDLFRFVDFRPGGSHIEEHIEPATQAKWDAWKSRHPELKHEPFCAEFLREQGYPELADIVEVHGLKLPVPERTTIEQQLLFYADKRMKVDELVTLDERFQDFVNRYGNGKASEMGTVWMAESKEIEKMLFPKGVPL